jgi:hypothetical protein
MQTTTTTKTRQPHCNQVWATYENLKHHLCSLMGIAEQDYCYQEFHFGVKLLNEYLPLVGPYIENIKKELLENKAHGYWAMLKAFRRAKELDFWKSYEEIYNYNATQNLLLAKNSLKEEWEIEHKSWLHEQETHEIVRHFLIHKNVML